MLDGLVQGTAYRLHTINIRCVTAGRHRTIIKIRTALSTAHDSAKAAHVAKFVWGLPLRTHSAMVAPICGLLQFKTELAYRCAKFITSCLNSSNCVIRLVARHCVFQRMRSPIGRNAQHCSSQFGVTVNQLANINKQVAYSYQYNAIWLSGIDDSTVTQLLDVKHNYACLPLFILSVFMCFYYFF